MAVDGNWNLVMSTPMGERKATLSVKSAGGALSGTQGADDAKPVGDEDAERQILHGKGQDLGADRDDRDVERP